VYILFHMLMIKGYA